MAREDEDDAGSWCVEDWEIADYDVIPPFVVEEQWTTGTSMMWAGGAGDEQLGRSPWVDEGERFVSGNEVAGMIKECSDEFHEEMLTLVLDVQQHHALLVEQLHKSKQSEDFVKVDFECQKVDKYVQTEDNDEDNSHKRQEMELLLEDFMKCSFNEHFNWDQRILRSPAVPKLSEEATAVVEGGNTLISMSKNDVKDLLKEFTDENSKNMKILVKEIQESNERLVNMLLRDCESTKRCLSELEKDMNDIIMPKGEGKANSTDTYQKIQEHQSEEKGLMIDLMESSYNSENNGWEEGLMIDFVETSYNEKNGWEEMYETFEGVDVYNKNNTIVEDWETKNIGITIPNNIEQSNNRTIPNNIEDMQMQIMKEHEKMKCMMEDFLSYTYHWNERISRNTGLTDSIVEISEFGMIDSIIEVGDVTDVYSTRHHCDSQPLCRSCTERENESNEQISLHCNLCSFPALCFTCIERRNQQLVLPTNRLSDIWRTYTEPEHIWYPGPWPPLRLSLVEKVKELDAREQDALLIGKWIRSMDSEDVKPIVYESRFTAHDNKDLITSVTSIEAEETNEQWERMNEKLNEMLSEEEVLAESCEEVIYSLGETSSVRRKWKKVNEEVKTMLENHGKSEMNLDELITWADEAAMAEQWARMNEKIEDVTDNTDVATHDVADLIVTVDETSKIKMAEEITRDILDENDVINSNFDKHMTSLSDELSTEDGWEALTKQLNAVLDEKAIEEFIASLNDNLVVREWNCMNENTQVRVEHVVIDPHVKEVVDSMIEKVSSMNWVEGCLPAEEIYENEWEETEDKLPNQMGADKLVNDFGYMWEFLV